MRFDSCNQLFHAAFSTSSFENETKCDYYLKYYESSFNIYIRFITFRSEGFVEKY